MSGHPRSPELWPHAPQRTHRARDDSTPRPARNADAGGGSGRAWGLLLEPPAAPVGVAVFELGALVNGGRGGPPKLLIGCGVILRNELYVAGTQGK